MTEKTKTRRRIKVDDPEQSTRFVETGKALGADKDEGALRRLFKRGFAKASGKKRK